MPAGEEEAALRLSAQASLLRGWCLLLPQPFGVLVGETLALLRAGSFSEGQV